MYNTLITHDYIYIAVIFGAAYLVTAIVLKMLPPLASRIGLVDKPTERKLHSGTVPLIGGIAMIFGFTFASMLLPVSLQDSRALFVALGLLVFLGVLDDFHELSPRSRLAGQLFAALLMAVWGGAVLLDLGHIVGMGDITLPLWAGWILTLFAIMCVINAFNMLDGLDGLAGSLSLIAVISLGMIAVARGNILMMGLLGVLGAVLIAFLQFNWRFTQRAKVFMGDAGSMFLGGALAWFAIRSTQGSDAIARPVTMLWLLALPLCELLTIVLSRLIQRKSPLQADRNHMHYLLLSYFSWPMWKVVSLMALTGALLASVGVVGECLAWPEQTLFLAFLTVFAAYAAFHFWLSSKIIAS